MSSTQELASPPAIADIAILTILPEAYDAVRSIFGLSGYTTRKGYQWTWGSVRLHDGSPAIVATGLPLDRENIAAATFVGAMLEAWYPRNLLLVDIGGAIKGRDDVRLGDVVTHTILHYYDYHKVEEDGNDSPRYLSLAGASSRLRELSRRPSHRGDNSWMEKISVKRPGVGVPKVLSGEMLVGGAIQSNSPRLLKLLEEYPKAICVEMEGVGAGRAVLDWSTRGTVPEFLIVRGMSDYCNVAQNRNQVTRDRWRRYAAAAAAAHAYSLIRELASQSGQETDLQAPHSRFVRPTRPIDNLWEVTPTVLRGRDRELRVLRERFSDEISEGQIRKPHVIWGEAGMGKSVLARTIAEDVESHFVARWWIDASDELKIRLGLREFARRLGIPSACTDLSLEGDHEVEVHRFLSDLREFLELRVLDGRALVVLDNVDDANLKHLLSTVALRYLPPSACDVLITSQSSRWHPVAPTDTPLQGLDPTTSAELIAYESGRPELVRDTDVEAICRDFAGRPLFLKQVAALLRDGDDPGDFRRRLNDSVEDALEVLPEIEGFEPLWRETYVMSIDRADNARPGAQKLLEVLAFFSPEPVPLTLLHATADLERGWRPVHVDAALSTLVDRSLIQCQREAGSRNYILHRIIGALVRTVVRTKGRISEILSSATFAVSRTLPNREIMRRLDGQRTMTALAPHVDTLTNHVLINREKLTAQTLERAAEACSMLGLHRRTLSEWVAAEDASRKAVELSDTIREPGNTALRKVRLANIMRQRAYFEPAQSLLDEALPLLREHGDSRDYAWALTVQARVLRHRPSSAPSEALPILYDALQLMKPFEDGRDASTLRQLSELHGYISVVCRQLSNFDAAESESVHGLRIITGGMRPDEALEATDLPDEPLLATHLRALGGVWRLRGDLKRAMHAHRRALEIFEHVYGPDNTDVLRALDSLGRVQREWGDLEGALESFARAEKISNLRFGPNHAHAGTAAVNLALVYLELGEPHNALTPAERGLRIYCLAYHEEYDDKCAPLRNDATVWALFVRANCLMELGHLKRAQDDHTSVLEWRQAHYSGLHAHIASSYYALGDVYSRIGEDQSRDLALSHHRQALTIREKVFGAGPNCWVAQSQARLGLLTNDRELLRLAHETYIKQLKPGHWRILELVAVIKRLEAELSS
jgi:tetratricopeptide (TPR) repeat protein/nucleoside phosphorylase